MMALSVEGEIGGCRFGAEAAAEPKSEETLKEHSGKGSVGDRHGLQGLQHQLFGD